MRYRNYYRFVNGQMEKATFNQRSKAWAGRWHTNPTIARKQPYAGDVPDLPSRRDELLSARLRELNGLNRDEVRDVAKVLNIAGRGKMNKDQLMLAVAETQVPA